MNMVSIIEKKKLGQVLSKEEIEFFVAGAADGSIPDYQLAALLMAIRLNGMTREETTQITLAMTNSGDVCDLSSLSKDIKLSAVLNTSKEFIEFSDNTVKMPSYSIAVITE